ncbi:YkgJ family cysteine cluster protein [bacterium]|nr:YkgJ family cysteine cluster protein [bacterium]
MKEIQQLPAGSFSEWLKETRRAQLEDVGVDVPCGSCNLCCRSSYFIHIKPDEIDVLSRIPEDLLFPAPGLPEGNVLMGYNRHGCCPMLINNKCSIYDYRPLTCRIYDCRIFSAAGILAGGTEKRMINRHCQHWQFDYPETKDRDEFQAVRDAVKFVNEHADCFPDGKVPQTPSQCAMLAIKVYDIFMHALKRGESVSDGDFNRAIALRVMETYKQFEKAIEHG